MTEEQKRRKMYALVRIGIALGVLGVCVLVMLSLRPLFERKGVMPIASYWYSRLYPPAISSDCTRCRSQEERIRQLEEDNKQLRRELGTIPEKSDMLPAHVIWIQGSHYTLAFEETEKSSLIKKGTPVIIGSVLMGTVLRHSSTMVIMQSVHDSNYKGHAKTEAGVQGELIGDFGQELTFRFPIGAKVVTDQRVYAVFPERGWQFLVGTINVVSNDRSKPFQDAQVATVPYNPQDKLLFMPL
ncbi:MAG: hypothetical protein NUV52_02330 [Candidatus Roizmanbacteria bacterium]|nr:hypothetical protein [Candidatus Roizmanbacteria bacterium]